MVRHRTWCLALAIVVAALSPPPSISAGEDTDEALRRRLEAAVEGDGLAVGDAPLRCETTLLRFYRARGFVPAWSRAGRLAPAADSLLASLQAADAEGLTPGDYHLDLLEAGLERERGLAGTRNPGDDARLRDLDLLLTDAWLLYGSHCLSGRVDPERIDSEWTANRRDGDLAAELESAIARDDVSGALRALLPPQTGYARLRAALRRLRDAEAAGGWPVVPSGPKLETGSVDPRVGDLAARLAATGDLDADPASYSGGVFDPRLADAVRAAQARHGLAADGVVGPATLTALNVPAGARAEQAAVNLERWRWLPQDLGARHVLVNIADQRLQMVADGKPLLDMAVIVGRTYRRTPVFSGRMTYLVFSPYWEVPPSLAVQDKLPELRRDPARLAAQGFQAFRGWGEAAEEVDLQSVDWSRVRSDAFPFRLRQKPGPQNALGGVKFMFPNRHNVYLHDTSARELFSRTVRTFSSGCIRIEKPADLALAVLHDRIEWTAETVRAAMASGEENTVRLAKPVPVHIEYWTAWVAPDGRLHLRDDVYGRDANLLAALVEPPHTSP